jgi:hypothetical protein
VCYFFSIVIGGLDRKELPFKSESYPENDEESFPLPVTKIMSDTTVRKQDAIENKASVDPCLKPEV